jgi:uncharacterized protein (TIGR03435 family)
MRIDSREILAVGIFGGKSSLAERIEILLRRGRTFSPRASSASVAASTIALSCLVLAGSLAPRWIAFAQEPSRLAFDADTVKLNRSGRAGFDGFQILHGSLTVRNVSLKMLIEAAYSIQGARISSGPPWMSSDRYDIVAKGAVGADKQQVWLMLRSLLADRFKLRVANEPRELPLYSLEVGKNGPRIRKRDDAECEVPPPPSASGGLVLRSCGGPAMVWGPQGGYMFGEKVAISAIGDSLSEVVDRPVVDHTNLAGAYDVDLKWTPDGYKPLAAEGEVRRPVDSTEPGPSIFTAVQDQLGLKLVATKGSVQVLVIDHVEKPDAN